MTIDMQFYKTFLTSNMYLEITIFKSFKKLDMQAQTKFKKIKTQSTTEDFGIGILFIILVTQVQSNDCI